jgi:hypothetical protein
MSRLGRLIRRNVVTYAGGVTPPYPGTARLWSDPSTHVPGSTDPNDVPGLNGDSFDIGAGAAITVDIDLNVGKVMCYGDVIISNSRDTNIDFRGWTWMPGSRLIFADGTPGNYLRKLTMRPRGDMLDTTPRMVVPSTGQAAIQLGFNNVGTDRSMIFDAGSEILGGPPRLAHHWRLSDHAQIGDVYVTLRGGAIVKQNDKFVISTTDYYGQSVNEEVEAASDSVNGVVFLKSPITHFHWGKLQWVTKTGPRTGHMSLVDENWRPLNDAPYTFDESAHVIRLNRSITVDGSMDGNKGGRVMRHGNSGTRLVRGWRFTYMGVQGTQGWYPLHDHFNSYEMPNGMNSPSNGNYVGGSLEASLCSGHIVEDCCVDHSQNRGFVAHGANGITYRQNVGFDIISSFVFLEEGSPRKLVIDDNHSILTRASVAPYILQNFDADDASNGVLARASAFWITNPDNIVTNNSAGDCITGFWNAFTNQNYDLVNDAPPLTPYASYNNRGCFGLSKKVPFAPGALPILQWDNNEAYAYRKMGTLTDFAQSDEAGNVGTEGYGWLGGPLEGLGPQILSRVKLWKGFRGYQNRVKHVEYRNFSGADVCGAMLNGATQAGSIASNGLAIAQSLNVTARPAGAPTYDAVAISYNGSLVFPGWIGVGYTIQSVGYDDEAGANGAGLLTARGFFKTWSEYLYPITVWGRRSAGIELLNSDFGFRTPPGWLTREAPYNKTDSIYFGGDLAGAMKQYDNYLGDTAVGKTWVYNIPFLTYGATGMVEPLPTGSNNGMLVNETFFGVGESTEGVPRYDGITYPLTNPKSKRDTRRLDPTTLAEVGHWIAPGGTAPDGSAIQTHGGIEFTHFAVMEGGVYKSIAPDIPQTYWYDVIFGSRVAGKSFVRGVPFTGAKTAKVAAGTNNDDMGGGHDYYGTNPGVAANYTRRYTAASSLADLISGAADRFWQDKPNNYVWYKYTGGYNGYTNDPTLDTYDYFATYVVVSAVTT